ncbi:hypothetical protein KVT40_007357 [Elsinoe batatas]|uniref:Uncharacterized protein n=1 Tax=Elsinoe batatas TaxID=2601811 RepID=A0A8K0KVY7_9PEZI|nr:hypothetical protein KVT40_007357 [Elsinoe batatas]
MSPLTKAASPTKASTSTTPLTSSFSPTSNAATPEGPGERNDTVLFAVLFGVILVMLLGVTFLWCRARKTSTLLSTQLRRRSNPAPDARDAPDDVAEHEGERGRHSTVRRAAFRVYPPGSGLGLSAPELIALSAEGVREEGERRRGLSGGVGDGGNAGGSAGVEGRESAGLDGTDEVVGTDEVDWAVERRDTSVAEEGTSFRREPSGEALETIREQAR